MLRAALFLSLAPALLAGCIRLPGGTTEAPVAETWPRLLSAPELEAALPPADSRPALATEGDLTARSAGLKARAEALRRRSVE